MMTIDEPPQDPLGLLACDYQDQPVPREVAP